MRLTEPSGFSGVKVVALPEILCILQNFLGTGRMGEQEVDIATGQLFSGYREIPSRKGPGCRSIASRRAPRGRPATKRRAPLLYFREGKGRIFRKNP